MEMSAHVMRISSVFGGLATVTANVSWCLISVPVIITVTMNTYAMMGDMTQSPERMRLILTYYQEKSKLTTPASQSVTPLLLSLISLASRVETSVGSTKTGVWRARATHVANTTSGQTTRSSVQTPHFGLGRLVTSFIQAGEKQLWAGDALVRLSTAPTPGTRQAFTITRQVYHYKNKSFQNQVRYSFLGIQKYWEHTENLSR